MLIRLIAKNSTFDAVKSHRSSYTNDSSAAAKYIASIDTV